MKTKWKKTGVIVLAAVVVLGALAATSFYRVGQGEEALVLTFGRVTDTRGPGLYWENPAHPERDFRKRNHHPHQGIWFPHHAHGIGGHGGHFCRRGQTKA